MLPTHRIKCSSITLVRCELKEKVMGIEFKVRVKGVTQTALRLGCHQTHLSRIMRGERKPSKALEKKMRRLGLVPGSAA